MAYVRCSSGNCRFLSFCWLHCAENYFCLIFPRDIMWWRSSSGVHIIGLVTAVNNLPLKQNILLFPAPTVCVTLSSRRVISELNTQILINLNSVYVYKSRMRLFLTTWFLLCRLAPATINGVLTVTQNLCVQLSSRLLTKWLPKKITNFVDQITFWQFFCYFRNSLHLMLSEFSLPRSIKERKIDAV